MRCDARPARSIPMRNTGLLVTKNFSPRPTTTYVEECRNVCCFTACELAPRSRCNMANGTLPLSSPTSPRYSPVRESEGKKRHPERIFTVLLLRVNAGSNYVIVSQCSRRFSNAHGRTNPPRLPFISSGISPSTAGPNWSRQTGPLRASDREVYRALISITGNSSLCGRKPGHPRNV